MAKETGKAVLNDLKGLTGNIAHAVICFPAVDHSDMVLEESGQDSAQAAAGAFAKAAEKLRGAVSAVTRGITGKFMPDGQENEFQVQFNPQTLQISARGGGRVPKTNYNEKGESTISYGNMDPSIDIRLTLLFDVVNLQDAFMADKLTAGSTSVIKGAGTALQRMAGKTYTVQSQVEGFLAALRDSGKRTITFRWGDLSYTGVLNHVTGRYTMFSPVGNPVRAEVELGMTCMGEDSLAYWYERYANMMDAEKRAEVTTGGLSNRWTNLLNL